MINLRALLRSMPSSAATSSTFSPGSVGTYFFVSSSLIESLGPIRKGRNLSIEPYGYFAGWKIARLGDFQECFIPRSIIGIVNYWPKRKDNYVGGLFDFARIPEVGNHRLRIAAVFTLTIEL